VVVWAVSLLCLLCGGNVMLRGCGGESIVVVISGSGYGEVVVIWDVFLSMATYTFIVYGLKC
jgi:hypothetical protein